MLVGLKKYRCQLFSKLPAIKLKSKLTLWNNIKNFAFYLTRGQVGNCCLVMQKVSSCCNTVITNVNEKSKFKDFAFTWLMLLFATSHVGKSIEQKNVGGLTCFRVKEVNCHASFTYLNLMCRQEGSFTWSYFQRITKALEIPVRLVYGEKFTTGQRRAKANPFQSSAHKRHRTMSGLDDKTRNLFHFQQRNSKQNGYLIIYLHDYLFLGGYCYASILKQKNKLLFAMLIC